AYGTPSITTTVTTDDTITFDRLEDTGYSSASSTVNTRTTLRDTTKTWPTGDDGFNTYYLNVAQKPCRGLVLFKKQWFASTILLQNRCPLRQNKLHLPAAYPRIDLASLIQTDPQRFWITGRLPLVYHK